MVEIIKGYDIDGTLTQETIKQEYINFGREPSISTLIVTSRSSAGLFVFLKNNPDVADVTDEEYSVIFKTPTLRRIKRNSNAATYEYVGNSLRDRITAMLSGWEFKSV